MSRSRKRKLLKVLKTLLDELAKPITQEEWLRGYREWVAKHKKHVND